MEGLAKAKLESRSKELSSLLLSLGDLFVVASLLDSATGLSALLAPRDPFSCIDAS